MTESTSSTFMRLVRGCFWVLAAAVALVLAVDLLRGIWPWLLGSVIVAVALIVAVRLWRFMQRDSW